LRAVPTYVGGLVIGFGLGGWHGGGFHDGNFYGVGFHGGIVNLRS